MKYPDFAKCYDAAEKVQKKTPNSKITYGLYTPLSDRNAWDERWIKDGCKSVLHWWVETENEILDAGSRQFGEESFKRLPKTDSRYVKVGHQINGIKEPVESDITINWYTMVPGHTVDIIWPTYDKYLKKLGLT